MRPIHPAQSSWSEYTEQELCAGLLYRSLGMRERILGLPLMVAAVVILVWNQVPSVMELSMETVWRGLYHFNDAYNRGLAHDPVAYLAAPENRDLSVIKPLRKPPKTLDFTPFFNSLTIHA